MRYNGIERYAGLFKEYTELRVQENRNVNIMVLKGNVVRNQRSTTGGVSARVFKDSVWGFASSPTIDDAAISRSVALATDNARFLAARENRKSCSLPHTVGSSTNDLSTTKSRVPQKELIDFARALDAYCLEKFPALQSRTVGLNLLDMEKTFINSDGSIAYSMIPRAKAFISLCMESGGETIECVDVFGGCGHFEDVFGDPAALYPSLDALYGHLVKKAEGVYASAGLHDVVLAPDLAGILAHEAIGHTVEADIVFGGSVAGDYLDQKVASELVTMVDFAHTAQGRTCPVPVWVDDEGTPARDAILIEKGVLKSYLHNKETAVRFGVAPFGNARAYQFSDEPLIRMRNTAILPGTSKLADMIADIEDGYYLIMHSNGQGDSTSEFMFGVIKGYEIRKGKLGRGLRDTTITGVAFDMLKTITALSDDMHWKTDYCGKKQLIPVGMGGPAVRCKITVGGR